MGIAVLGLAAVVAVVLASAASGRRWRRLGLEALPTRARSAARTVAAWRIAGVGVGIAAAAWSLEADSLGRGVLLAAPVFALCVLAGVVVGELLVSAPSGAVREAGLAVRRWQDYLPPRLPAVVGTGTALLAGILVVAVLVASPDDTGRPGRTLTRQVSAVSAETHGPWPGSFYAVPLALVVAAGLLLAGAALLRIARRPSQGEDAVAEDALRRRSAAAVAAAAGLLVAVPLAGVSAIAAVAVLGFEGRPLLWSVLGWGLVAVLVLALGLAARCAVVLLVPALSEPRRTPAPVGR